MIDLGHALDQLLEQTESCTYLAAFSAARSSPPKPSLAEVRSREAEGRRSWEQDIAQTLPDHLRDGYRLGRWMQWAGHVLLARTSWAADDAGAERPNEATWARAHRLLEYAEIVKGAATRWLLWQAETSTSSLVIRNGKVDVPEPAPLPPAPPPPPARPLTLDRIADAVGMIVLGPHPKHTPGEKLFAQRLADELTRRRRPIPPPLRDVASRYVTVGDLARTVKPESFIPAEAPEIVAEVLARAERMVDEMLVRRHGR